MLHLHEKGNPEGDLQTLADHYAAWRETFASDPVKAVREATRAVQQESFEHDFEGPA